jgi:hypothetical protein
MKYALLLVTILASCAKPAPGPVGPQPQPTASTEPAEPPVAPATPAAEPAAPPAPAAPPTDGIDPAADMPETSLSTTIRFEPGKDAVVVVDGRSDLFSAGLAEADKERGGMLPAQFVLAPGGGTVTFSKVAGRVGCSGGGETAGPDGGGCAGGNTNLTAGGSVSGIVHKHKTQFLAGVFLGDTPSLAPKGLDFSKGTKLGDAFATLAPKLGQSFFIGDGQANGKPQTFVIPQDATKLFIGYCDGYSFQGKPGYYDDNTGGLTVTAQQQTGK